jgi:hypothetical protein
MKCVIDRIEGNIAVCESDDGRIVEIAIIRLPKAVKEGSAIFIEADGTITTADNSEREKRIADKMKAVWK